MGVLDISMEHVQIAKYVIGAVVAMILLVTLWNQLKGPLRRKKMAAFARRLDLDFTPRLRFSEAQAGYNYAKDVTLSRSDHDTVDPPNKLRIESIFCESVLNDPRFFSVFNTSQIRNYCNGVYRSFPVEIFDWQQSRGRNDRSSKGPRSTLVVLRIEGEPLPWFIASPSIDSNRRKITNTIQPSQLPEFNASHTNSRRRTGTPTAKVVSSP